MRPGDLLISVNGTMVAEDMLDALAERGHDSWSLCFMRESRGARRTQTALKRPEHYRNALRTP